ncbi:N-acetylmuramic acid 6-phosphate etherase [Anaerorhabdus sp.]|uniref:N-acetylmuramic acid 6-phosphate etherase n=1 Tax=Anaerorhabdus sp. TaxID=1872524 RepID=UPI002B208027|nr:N-acetylmuramic acid 6-phosphate etherase [Anaerorhabdus sp.]MEA4874280.1 N-acetylmuramic acid 6-phosphate etherase [Anaerorhabdus sp.]
MLNIDLNKLSTEKRNELTMELDSMSSIEFLSLMNKEDQQVPLAVEKELESISQATEMIIDALNKGGRLIYLGAGTSGRLGVLDAVECSPTFQTTTEVMGLIAGGDSAFVKAKEGAEDSEDEGANDILNHDVNSNDVVVGIAASGRTPYVIGALKKARSLNARTVAVACNKNSLIGNYADIKIEVEVGPEVLTGSTRLKAGTAQKLVLNMLSTASMVGIGKTYKNLMVDLKPSNLKLVERAKKIIMEATGCPYEIAEEKFIESGQSSKIAIVMILTGLNREEALHKLEKNNGFIKKSI